MDLIKSFSMESNFVKIIIIDRLGKEHHLEAPTDMNMNLMELCKSYELPVEGTCGGMAMCASCQIYIESNHVSLERSKDEQAMLDEAWNVQENSRLGCQIKLTTQLNGLIVKLAPETATDEDW
jgi:ferredoxin-2, mitochondrial